MNKDNCKLNTNLVILVNKKWGMQAEHRQTVIRPTWPTWVKNQKILLLYIGLNARK